MFKDERDVHDLGILISGLHFTHLLRVEQKGLSMSFCLFHCKRENRNL